MVSWDLRQSHTSNLASLRSHWLPLPLLPSKKKREEIKYHTKLNSFPIDRRSETSSFCSNGGGRARKQQRRIRFRRVQPPELLLISDLCIGYVLSALHCHALCAPHHQPLHSSPRLCKYSFPFFYLNCFRNQSRPSSKFQSLSRTQMSISLIKHNPDSKFNFWTQILDLSNTHILECKTHMPVFAIR